MIVSVSRRTDIPAFYSQWFFNRIQAGEVLIRNPFNRNQVSRVILNKDWVDCFVFWTKNPQPMLEKLHLLKDYSYYFQFTLNAYGEEIEPKVGKKQNLIETFKTLSQRIGKDKVIWRYDPILINNMYTKEYHYKWFAMFAQKLAGYTEQCIISFVDDYKESKKNATILGVTTITEGDMLEIGARFADIAQQNQIKVTTCAEKIDLSTVGISHGQCIDPQFISKLIGKDCSNFQQDTLRTHCKCVKSVDIGEYNSCLHYCQYCYANYNSTTIERNNSSHDQTSPLLLGNLGRHEKITLHYLCKKVPVTFEQLQLL